MLTAGERKALSAATTGHASKGTLKQILADNEWVTQPALAAALKKPMMRLCARYLLTAKRDDGRALDPVAHFHLGNGARVESLNWLADTSTKGLQQSCSMMVNYLYPVSDIEAEPRGLYGIEHRQGLVVGERTALGSSACRNACSASPMSVGESSWT